MCEKYTTATNIITMDNREKYLHALTELAENPPDTIPQILDQYLLHIARTGDPMFDWSLLKPLVECKVRGVVEGMGEEYVREELETLSSPNVPTLSFHEHRRRIMQAVRNCKGTPFTIQRLCELLMDPKKNYKRADKYMRALEKALLVVGTVDQYVKKSESGPPSRPKKATKKVRKRGKRSFARSQPSSSGLLSEPEYDRSPPPDTPTSPSLQSRDSHSPDTEPRESSPSKCDYPKVSTLEEMLCESPSECSLSYLESNISSTSDSFLSSLESNFSVLLPESSLPFPELIIGCEEVIGVEEVAAFETTEATSFQNPYDNTVQDFPNESSITEEIRKDKTEHSTKRIEEKQATEQHSTRMEEKHTPEELDDIGIHVNSLHDVLSSFVQRADTKSTTALTNASIEIRQHDDISSWTDVINDLDTKTTHDKTDNRVSLEHLQHGETTKEATTSNERISNIYKEHMYGCEGIPDHKGHSNIFGKKADHKAGRSNRRKKKSHHKDKKSYRHISDYRKRHSDNHKQRSEQRERHQDRREKTSDHKEEDTCRQEYGSDIEDNHGHWQRKRSVNGPLKSEHTSTWDSNKSEVTRRALESKPKPYYDSDTNIEMEAGGAEKNDNQTVETFERSVFQCLPSKTTEAESPNSGSSTDSADETFIINSMLLPEKGQLNKPVSIPSEAVKAEHVHGRKNTPNRYEGRSDQRKKKSHHKEKNYHHGMASDMQSDDHKQRSEQRELRHEGRCEKTSDHKEGYTCRQENRSENEDNHEHRQRKRSVDGSVKSGDTLKQDSHNSACTPGTLESNTDPHAYCDTNTQMEAGCAEENDTQPVETFGQVETYLCLPPKTTVAESPMSGSSTDTADETSIISNFLSLSENGQSDWPVSISSEFPMSESLIESAEKTFIINYLLSLSETGQLNFSTSSEDEEADFVLDSETSDMSQENV